MSDSETNAPQDEVSQGPQQAQQPLAPPKQEQKATLIQIMNALEDTVGRMDSSLEQLESEEQKKELTEQFEQVKLITILFQQRAITEITGLDKQLKDIKKRELEWKELADIFSEYRVKMTTEMESMRDVIEQYKEMKDQLTAKLAIKERENAGIMDELGLYKDLIIRVEALKRRRQNVEKLNRQLEADENAFMDILNGVRSIPSIIDIKDVNNNNV